MFAAVPGPTVIAKADATTIVQEGARPTLRRGLPSVNVGCIGGSNPQPEGGKLQSACALTASMAAVPLAAAASKRATVSRRSRRGVARCSEGTPASQDYKPREGKVVNNAVWFDIELSLPLGLGLKDAGGDRNAVIVEEVRDGGSAAAHNDKYILAEPGPYVRQHFILEGDQLLMVNGQTCNCVADAVEYVQAAEDQEHIRLKFARQPIGSVRVVFPEDGTQITAPHSAQASEAAENAGHEVEYKCTDGTCGSCWRRDERSGEVYLLCIDDITVGRIPSKTAYSDGDDIFWSDKKFRERKFAPGKNFNNTEPLVLKSCPEVYQQWRKDNPLEAARSDATVSRFGGILDGLAPGQSEAQESKSKKWGGSTKSWSGLD
eukprot:TRINITY_DN56922_c0_g2_i1.p1 TRINITY_DN56922_c0_g2~~TRINITY_DN56922_c0_g2_i1.p1  ORF type:complete len:376 (-),score=91.06 TRINITY_DN56922_c0_g2_i1:196-1323(-)